ncbi:MAG: TonB-dependent receptor plug domain-containing protein [Acidobacteria bacterium]|nr:TonB-dependent receptor plug domain-containing protein [Acidobacteriota bacterium]
MGHGIILALLLLTANPKVSEQVVVTAKAGSAEKTEVIDQKTVDKFTLLNSADLFEFFPSLSLSTRGPGGIQADISFRGARGNQIGVLLNGIPLNNAQTYHHNFDIPVAPEDLQTFSVRPAASGGDLPYGFSGQVNLETGSNRKERYNFVYGTDRYYHVYAAQYGLSYLLEGSDGYRPNTDFHTTNVTWQGEQNGVKVFTAFNRKDFGAQDFYAPYASREKTETYLASTTWKNLTVYGIRHDDTFLLDRDHPDFYKNVTRTVRSGFHQEFQLPGNFFLSYDFTANSVSGIVLGQHNDHQLTAKGATVLQAGGFTLRPGLTFVDSSRDRGEWMPFVGIYRMAGQYSLSIEASRTVRLPDYTELYYQSPVNRGNPELCPEKAWNVNVTVGRAWWKATFFYRNESGIIDWVRRDAIWHAENIEHSRVQGLEVTAVAGEWSAGYQMVSRNSSIDLETKYTWYAPKNRWVIRYNGKDLSMVYQFLDIPGLPNASVLDLTFFGTGFYLKIKNSLDDSYETLPGIPMPGRSYLFGYRVNGPLLND